MVPVHQPPGVEEVAARRTFHVSLVADHEVQAVVQSADVEGEVFEGAGGEEERQRGEGDSGRDGEKTAHQGIRMAGGFPVTLRKITGSPSPTTARPLRLLQPLAMRALAAASKSRPLY